MGEASRLQELNAEQEAADKVKLAVDALNQAIGGCRNLRMVVEIDTYTNYQVGDLRPSPCVKSRVYKPY